MDEYNALNTVIDALWEQLDHMERRVIFDEEKLTSIDATINGLLKITLLISDTSHADRSEIYKTCHHVRDIDTVEFLPINFGNLFIRCGMLNAQISSLRLRKEHK